MRTHFNFYFQAEEELYGAHAQPQKPLMKAGASVIESAESGIELSASAQSGSRFNSGFIGHYHRTIRVWTGLKFEAGGDGSGMA